MDNIQEFLKMANPRAYFTPKDVLDKVIRKEIENFEPTFPPPVANAPYKID